ncbi:MAG: hypothetical protein M3503_06115 [Actinomycetota bacterium]|nr:hypothetical protein [Actinomycetota bacterium]
MAGDGGELSEYVDRVVGVPTSPRGDGSALRRLRIDLDHAASAEPPGSYERGFLDGLAKVVGAALARRDRGGGLAAQSAVVEPGSVPARMLLEIAGGVRGANADLADRLGTDQWQISRAGRRLRELGLAERTRAGRLNGWSLTSDGERQVSVLRRV